MFAYCGNNPTNMTDQTGELGAWWQTALSVGAIVAGLALTATGVGGVAGAMLVSAGASSLVGGELSEANGGSYAAGWIGGGIGGAICGGGAGLGGALFNSATESVGMSVLGCLGKAIGVSYGTGVFGNIASLAITDRINGDKIDWKETISTSLVKGTTNIFSAIGCGMTNLLTGQGSPSINRALGVGLSVSVQAITDAASYLIERLWKKKSFPTKKPRSGIAKTAILLQ